ncbi:hypothetical protein [Devosia sp.]|uniref:hypothetical protein n=1 Tax=Devosia sp. TaxID=1871048 RepID=UPI001B270710|nr:hypothetical protein [Devosia sp.]MBO9591084.1 hypothetical protein [Devosia sp.]
MQFDDACLVNAQQRLAQAEQAFHATAQHSAAKAVADGLGDKDHSALIENLR